MKRSPDPYLPGHSWQNAVAMATPIAHNGSTTGAKLQSTTALDFMLDAEQLGIEYPTVKK
jgi:aminobenzoyl-glutamate utilization protein B